MDINNQLLKTLNDIANTLKRGGGSWASSEPTTNDADSKNRPKDAKRRANEEKQKTAMNDNASAFYALQQKQSIQSLESHAEITSAIVSRAINKANFKQLESLPDQVRETLLKSSNLYVNSVADSVNDLEDVMKLQETLVSRAANMESFEKFQEEMKNGTATLKEFNKFKSLGFTRADLHKTTDELVTDSEELSRAFSKATDKIERVTQSKMSKLGGIAMTVAKWAPLGTALSLLAREILEATKASAKMGTALNIFDAQMMGMNSENLSALQKEHKQTIGAMGGNYDKFNDIVKDGAWGLISYTGSMEEGAKAVASFGTNFLMLGGKQKNMGSFIDQQSSQFKRWNKVFSTTAEEFGAMNTHLTASASVQNQLYKLSQRERVAHMQNLQRMAYKLQLDGMSIEQSLRMLDTITKIGSAKPKDRLKKAANIQAVMSAMGLADLGAEAAKIIRAGHRGDPNRLAEILKIATTRDRELRQTFNGEILQSQLMSKSGLEDVFGIDSAAAVGEIQKGRKISTKAEQLLANKQLTQSETLNKALRNLMLANDIGTAFLQGSLMPAMVAGFAAVVMATRMLGPKIMSAGARGLAGIKSSGVSFGKIAGGAVGLAAAAYIGSAVGDAANSWWEKNHPESYGQMSDVVGITFDSMLSVLGDKEAQSRRDSSDAWGTFSENLGGAVDNALSFVGVESATQRLQMQKDYDKLKIENDQATKVLVKTIIDTGETTATALAVIARNTSDTVKVTEDGNKKLDDQKTQEQTHHVEDMALRDSTRRQLFIRSSGASYVTP